MSFIDYFGSITDPRKDINVKHALLDVIFLTVTGVVSGCEGWKDIYEFGCTKLEWVLPHIQPKLAKRALLPNQQSSRLLNDPIHSSCWSLYTYGVILVCVLTTFIERVNVIKSAN